MYLSTLSLTSEIHVLGGRRHDPTALASQFRDSVSSVLVTGLSPHPVSMLA